MTRAQIDALDKPYGPPSAAVKQPPPLQSTRSTPDLGLLTSSPSTNFSKRSPLSSNDSPTSFTRPSPVSVATSPAPTFPRRLPSYDTSTKDSVSTGRSRTSSKAAKANETASTPTIGTPYQETSPAFPPPQLVTTRPRTSGTANATVAGVSVPTHHTSSQPAKPTQTKATEKAEKSERRKTRFLNPMAVFSRSRSTQDDESISAEKQAQAAALQRQQKVAAAGGFVNRIPDDFDPRIKGTGVHDFSAPRFPKRGYSYSNDPEDSRGYIPTPLIMKPGTPESPRHTDSQQGPRLTFVRQSFNTNRDSTSTSASASTGRRNTGHFQEHLGDDTMPAVPRVQAERLENKDFLQRASYISQQSSMSQESTVLPPFARRSQGRENLYSQGWNEDGSRPTSGVSRITAASALPAGQRDSNVSSVSNVSPVTVSSPAQGANYDTQASFSPISPSSDSRVSKGYSEKRPISEYSGRALSVGSSKQERVKSSATSISSGSDAPPHVPSQMPSNIPTQPPNPSATESAEPTRTSPRPPISITIPDLPAPSRPPPEIPPRAASHTLQAMSPLSTINSPSIDIPSDAPTPEPQVADSVRFSQVPSDKPSRPRLVEKLASAVGHSSKKRNANTGTPKHHASNASRFSFQFGGSAAEELALEEKARKVRQNGEGVGNTLGDEDEDDDDFFDEDAMDDMDEMEMLGQSPENEVPPTSIPTLPQHIPQHTLSSAAGTVSPNGSNRASVAQFMYRPAAAPSKPRGSMGPLELQIQPYDSGESEDEEAPYWDHEDFLGYEEGEQSRRESEVDDNFAASATAAATNGVTSSGRQRGASASSGLAPIDTNLANGGAKGNFYAQPNATMGYPTPPTASSGTVPFQRQPRDSSGSSERQRVLSGLSFSTTTADDQRRTTRHGQHTPAMSSSTAGGTSSSSEPRTLSTGLGLSGFSDFKFSDSPSSTRPTSYQADLVHGVPRENRRTKDSLTIPEDVDWTADSSKPSPAMKRTGTASSEFEATFGQVRDARRSSSPLVHVTNRHGIGDDDMYFDDGGFEADVNSAPPVDQTGTTVDESAFDDDNFLPRNSNAGPQTIQPVQSYHQRETSGLTATSLGSDGPYPSFAMLNATAARARDSRMLLEDLPLHEAPVDPRNLPRRNLSEDAKRLGLSSKAPPLPAQGNSEATQRMQASLQSYHAALAEAANRAAAEGKFLRAPSQKSGVGVEGSGSAVGSLLSPQPSFTSQYSRITDEERANVNGESERSIPDDPSAPAPVSLETIKKESPPKLSFDFGFDTSLGSFDDTFNVTDDSYDDLLNSDDDIVAAANAEALANDDEGFYGQEFGFYAKARPNSGDLQAMNGGYFGPDGDDGLTRNKSLKEPNLTPITERSEFSTRNSFIGHFGPASAGPLSAGSAISPALARLPFSPLTEGDVPTSFDELRKLRAHAFGGSNGSIHSDSTRASQSSLLQMAGNGESPTVSGRSSGAGASAANYFGHGNAGGGGGGAPMSFGYSDSSNSSAGGHNYHNLPPHPAFANAQGGLHESPRSTISNASFSFPAAVGETNDATPKRPSTSLDSPAPLTARKASNPPPPTTTTVPPPQHKFHGHSRNSSGADSVTYVKEMDPDGHGPPRWVLERRRTSELGLSELVGREVVQGGWI